MKTFQFFPKVSILPKSLNSSQKSQFFPTAVLKSSQQSQKEKEREISKIQSISQVQNAEEFYLLLYSIPLRTHLFSPPSICQLWGKEIWKSECNRVLSASIFNST